MSIFVFSLLGEQIDLQVEMIATFRNARLAILGDEDYGGETDGSRETTSGRSWNGNARSNVDRGIEFTSAAMHGELLDVLQAW